MRSPRLVFAALTLFICLLLDLTVGAFNTSAPNANTVPMAMVPDLPVSPSVAASSPSKEPLPVINPPSFKVPDKTQGLLPPPALSSPAAAAVAVFADKSFSELPEPQTTQTGLLLLAYADAKQLCEKQGKRLPSILDTAKWAAHNGALVASAADAKQLGRDRPSNAIYLDQHTKSVDFYYDKDRFSYPAKRAITNAAIWTNDDRQLGGQTKARHYAFSLYSASFSPVPSTSSLAVVCLNKK